MDARSTGVRHLPQIDENPDRGPYQPDPVNPWNAAANPPRDMVR
jgi:hypothetical protein